MIPPPPTALRIADNISEWEVPFAIDIGLDVPFVGRIDCFGEHRDTKETWPVDFKTSSEVSARLFDCFTINAQGLAYAMVAHTLVPNAITGLILDVLRVSPSNCETVTHPIYYTDVTIEAFLQWARYTGEEILACEQMENFPCNPSACNPYGQYGMPGYCCPYQILCQSSDWTTLLGMFSIREPKPFVLSEKDGD